MSFITLLLCPYLAPLAAGRHSFHQNSIVLAGLASSDYGLENAPCHHTNHDESDNTLPEDHTALRSRIPLDDRSGDLLQQLILPRSKLAMCARSID